MPYHVHVAVAGEDRIAIWTLDPRTGRLTFQEDVAIGGSPRPLAIHHTASGSFLYAGLRAGCEIASFALDHSTGSLSLLGTVSLSADPCYISTDRTGRYLIRGVQMGTHRLRIGRRQPYVRDASDLQLRPLPLPAVTQPRVVEVGRRASR